VQNIRHAKLNPIEEINEAEPDISNDRTNGQLSNGHTNTHTNGHLDNEDDVSAAMDSKMELNLREQLGIDDETNENEDNHNNNQSAIESILYEDE
jgi:hypothetical protein